MAAGYIGKISAVVTANTSDLTKKLADAGKNTKRFSEDLNRSISSAANSAQNSLQKIFTPLQNIERRLQTSLKVPGLDLPLDKIRAAVSLTEQINKPLARVASGFTGLSLEVQGSFLPALQRAQDQALLLNRRIEQTGNASEKSFSIATRTIDETAQALQRLSQAESIVQGGLSGRELQFRDPGVFNSLTRTASLTQKAGNLPPSVLADGAVRGTVERLAGLSEQIKLQFSRIETLRLSPKVDTTQVEEAEQSLRSLVREAEQVQESLDKIVSIDARVKNLGFRDGNPKGPYGPPLSEDMKLGRASGDLNILSEFDVEVSRTRANMQEIRQEALKLGEAFDSVSNQRFFDASIFRKQQGELSALRDIVGRVSADVRGPLEDAFTRYAATVTSALGQGERGFQDNTEEIQRQRAELIKLAAETKQVGNAGAITANVNRAGDVGRAGFDKFSLALNQAAFAVDDFLSATGGIEFRIRAVQNNLTQLAFILGDTKGLFVGLGVAIAAQAAVALSQFLLEGRKTEDVVKSLNDSLSRQRELADGISSSIEDIADAFAGDVFSDATKSADAFSEKLKKLATDLADLREARIGAADAAFQQNQADVNSLERRLSNESDGGVRIAIQRQLVSAREQSDRLIADAAARGGSRTLEQNIARFREAAIAFEQTKIDAELSKNTDSFVTITPRRAAENIDSLLSRITTQDQLRSLIESRSLETSRSISTGDGIARALTSQQAATSEIQALESIAISMDGYDAAAESLARFAEESDSIRQSLSDARNRLENFGDGVDSASEFSDMLDQAGRVVEEAFKNVSDAFEQAAAETTSFDDFNTAVREAIASVNAESDRRKKLVADIASVFNEEEAARRDELRKAADDAARQAEQDKKRAEEELRSSAERGRRLLLGEQGRAAEELRKNLNDVQAAGGTQQQVQAYARDVAQQSAPAIFALQEAVANAVASGPNREKLAASDISTQQGNAELMRLIRGDDAARAQNLQELRTQSNLLRRLVSVTQNNQAGVAD